MSRQIIDGQCYAQMLMAGAAELSAHTAEINDLNVFPVCDGDTGTNMSKTIAGGLAEISANTATSISALSERFARGVLLAARGNSGVILSQIFAGINEGLAGHESVSAIELADAYRRGIAKSYAAVQNPTEGTILTVFRESTDYAARHLDEKSSIEDFFRLHIDEAQRSLAATKELLPVLAEADVVDSGAAGYLCIAEGMYGALTGKTATAPVAPAAQAETAALDIDLFTRDSVLEFGYCTEFLLRLTTAKCNPDCFEIKALINALEDMGGESIVAYQQSDIVKVHVHTFAPGEVLALAQRFGEFLTVKVENMSLGHSNPTPVAKPKSNKKFSVLAVASGEGLCSLFEEMGADCIIAGGQTANPSIEEFVEAFKACDTPNIIVLPNNKNVIIAAKQAASLYEGAAVHIIETKTLMQGYAALSVINPGITDIETLTESAQRAARDVIGVEVTRAVRDANLNGRSIKVGDYIAIGEGGIVAVTETPEQAVCEALAAADTDLCELITLFVGKGVSEDARATLTEQLEEEYPDCEITVYEGGQDVYDYMVAVE
ncbi:MAG: DAK2 domain-containing protein [Clostridia bacterium]|nr:DAK2 domain-containing protein [Clostridia bacterium]